MDTPWSGYLEKDEVIGGFFRMGNSEIWDTYTFFGVAAWSKRVLVIDRVVLGTSSG